MSYFFETAGICSYNKTREQKSGKFISLPNDRKSILEIISLPHHRKHSINRKYILKPKLILKESLKNNYKGKKQYKRNKSKYCLHMEIDRLNKKNRSLAAKLKKTELDLEKDDILLKVWKRYQKLEQCYHELETEYKKINNLLVHQENKFKQLNVHQQNNILLTRKLEQDQYNVITIQKLKNDNIELNEDVNLLKNVIYYLNIELEKYQDKLRTFGKITKDQTLISNIDEIKVHFENKNSLKSWGRVNMHALAPLLNAYQENINEKNVLIQKYKKEIDIFTGNIIEVISENNNLYIEIENLKIKSESYFNQMKLIQKDVNIIKEQNDLLTQQSIIQKHKIQEICSTYEKKIKSNYQDNNNVSKECFTYKNELIDLKGKYEIIKEAYHKLKNNFEESMPVSAHNIAIEECKKLFDELKYQYESDKKKLNTRIKYLEVIQPENDKKQFTLIMEYDQLRIQDEKLKKHLKQMQHKMQYLQKVINAIEMSRDLFKVQLNKTTSYCEKLVNEQEKLINERKHLVKLLKEREKENEDVHHLGSNITHRIETIKNQLKTIQDGSQEQLISVEKYIKNQEQGVNLLKAKYERELQRFKKLLDQKEEVIQRLQREKYNTQDHLELIWKAAIAHDNNTHENNIFI